MTALSGTPTTRLGLKTFAAGDVPDLYSATGGLTEVLTQIDAKCTANSMPTTAKTASATLTAAESVGYRVTMTSASATTITINTGVFTANDSVFITNLGAGVCTVTAGTATVSSAGSLAIPRFGSGLLVMTATGTGIYYPSAAGNAVNTVASASSIAVTGDGTYLLTGTTTVSTITGGTTGMTITLQASGQSSGVPVILTYGTGSNAIKLRGALSLGIYAFVPADNGSGGAGESVTLRYDGTTWVEINRDLRTVLTYNNAVDSGTISATTAATADVLGTATSITFDGVTPMVITFYLYQWATGNTASSTLFANLYDGSTAGQRIANLNNISTGQQGTTLMLQVRLTPTAAARAYSIRAFRVTSNGEWSSSSGTATNSAGQGFIRIERDI